jgi:hypothetical protein
VTNPTDPVGALPRQSIAPTYDSGGNPGAYTVESRVGGRRIDQTPMSDPFVSQRVTVGWRDLLHGLRHRRLEVEIIVSAADLERIEDVLELDGNYLGRQGSSRRAEWDARLERGLGDFAAVQAEHDSDTPDDSHGASTDREGGQR